MQAARVSHTSIPLKQCKMDKAKCVQENDMKHLNALDVDGLAYSALSTMHRNFLYASDGGPVPCTKSLQN
eukprot:540068-Pelagomonas_calceolata.AAC.3